MRSSETWQSFEETGVKQEKRHARGRMPPIQNNESLDKYALRVKAEYESRGREARFDYRRVLLEALRQRTQEGVEKKQGTPWFKRIKDLLTERTDAGLLLQTTSLYALGLGTAMSAPYLHGEWGYLAPMLFAFGGERYLKGLIKTVLYFGESRARSMVDSAAAALRKDIRQHFKKGSLESVQQGLDRIRQRDDQFRKANERLRGTEQWVQKIEWGLPKLVMASAVTGLIPGVKPIPVPVGFQDWDGKALPKEFFNLVLHNMKSGTIHFATDVIAGVGKFGKFIVDQADTVSQVAPQVFGGHGEKLVSAATGIGVGVGLFGNELGKGIMTGAHTRALAFHDVITRFLTAAQQGAHRLSEGLHRPGMSTDLDKPPPFTVPLPKQNRSQEAIDRHNQEIIEKARQTLREREEEKQRTVQELRQQEEQMRDILALQATPLVWREKPDLVRARILAQFGIFADRHKGSSYQVFKSKLSAFVFDADRQHLGELQNFLNTYDHQLNGTKKQGVILMWVDRRSLLKKIESRLSLLPKIDDTSTDQASGPLSVKQEEEPVSELEKLLADVDISEVSQQYFPPVTHARNVLRSYLLDRIPAAERLRVESGEISLDQVRAISSGMKRELSKLDTMGRNHIAHALLREIHHHIHLKADYDEPDYQQAWKQASTINFFRDDIRVRVDESTQLLYRGSRDTELDPKNITIWGRLNITLNPQSIRALDNLIRQGAPFFYQIANPDSKKSAISRHDSVTLFFTKPLRPKLREALSRISLKFARGKGENLVGERITSHFSLADPFINQISREHTKTFFSEMQSQDQELAKAIQQFFGAPNTLSEETFYAIKTMLRAFGISIYYDLNRGVVFIESSHKDSVA